MKEPADEIKEEQQQELSMTMTDNEVNLSTAVSESDDSGSDDDERQQRQASEQGRVVKCRPMLIMTPVKVSARCRQQSVDGETGSKYANTQPACDIDELASEFTKAVKISSSSTASSSSSSSPNDKAETTIIKPDVDAVSSSTLKKKRTSAKKTKDVATGTAGGKQDQLVKKEEVLGRVDGNHFSYLSCKTSPVKRSSRIQQNSKYN
jgi:hypothetical protein